MTDFVKYVIEGVPLGCVFALVAIGLVLTYKTSGVFNLAFGAQAYVAAVLFYELRVRNEWSTLAAFVVVVLIASPLMGLLLEVLIFRHLRTAPPLAKLVSSLGLLVAVPQFVAILLGTEPTFGVKGIWWNDDALYKFGDYVLDGKEMAVIVSTVAAVVLLGVLFRYAPIGLRMRAVVESPRMTELAGVDADRVSAFSWMLSSLFAGLAGVLLAPLYASLAPQNFTTLLVAAIAAAAFARLTSIPLALLGGILLGVAQALLAGYLPPASVLAQNLRPSLPFAALFLLLLFWPGLRTAAASKDPLSGVDPPPMAPVAATRSRFLTLATRIFGLAVGGIVLRPRDDDVQRALGQHLHDRGDLLGDPALDHGHHRHGRRDLAGAGDVRGHRRVRDRAARVGLRARGAPDDVHRRAGRRARRRDRRGPAAPARRDLPVARHARDRARVRDGDRAARLGERRRAPGARCRVRSGSSTTARSCCCAS